MDFTLILEGIAVLGIMGAVFGALLAFAAKIFHVEVDPKQEAVRECLAGANCGGCGYPGCDGYAAAVAAGQAPGYCCVAGGQEAADKIAAIMGVSAGAEEKMVAFVPCSGAEGVAVKRFNYKGPQDCQAAMLFGGKSSKERRFAYIGLGNCARACKFGAMHIVNGVAKVDRDKCVGCMACADACPKKIIEKVPLAQAGLAPSAAAIRTRAPSRARSATSVIGCMKCQRECPGEPSRSRTSCPRSTMTSASAAATAPISARAASLTLWIWSSSKLPAGQKTNRQTDISVSVVFLRTGVPNVPFPAARDVLQ
ncbi:MAG: (Fe-S)-binding protein [Merdibacter sp.]